MPTNANYSLLNQITSKDMSSNINGPVIDLNLHTLGSITISWTGTPTGEFSIQVSDEVAENASLVSNNSFITINGSVFNATGIAGSENWSFASTYVARYVRFIYKASSGTGTITSCYITLRSL